MTSNRKKRKQQEEEEEEGASSSPSSPQPPPPINTSHGSDEEAVEMRLMLSPNSALSPTGSLGFSSNSPGGKMDFGRVNYSMPTIDSLDDIFVSPLEVTEPKLRGEVQKMNLLIFRHRARQVLNDNRAQATLQLFLFINMIAMITTPRYKKNNTDSFWATLCNIIMLLVLIVSWIEFAVYVLGNGFFPATSKAKASTDVSRIRSILKVWSPLRMRQQRVEAPGQIVSHKPLLENNLLCLEVLLSALSVCGYVIPGNTGFSRMRYFHGIRSLRLVAPLTRFVPTIQHLIITFRYSMSMLASAITFLIFFFLVFGVFGVDQFKGDMRHRCVRVNPVHSNVNLSSYLPNELCLSRGDGNVTDDCVEAIPPVYCDRHASSVTFDNPIVCVLPMVCRERPAPNYGYTQFDNIFSAWLTMFQIASLSHWSTLMYKLWGDNAVIWGGLYCTLLIITVSFVILNFITAIVASAYSKSRNKMMEYDVIAAFQRRSKKSSLLLFFIIDQLVWWKFSSLVVHHLSFVKETPEGRKRVPFFKHRHFVHLSNFIVAVIVILHAINGTHMSKRYAYVLSEIEIVYLVFYAIEIFFSILSCSSLGGFLSSDWRKFEMLSFVLTIAGVAMKLPLSVVRSLRVIRFIRKVPFVRRSNLLRAAVLAVRPSLVVASFLLVCVFVMAAVGVQMFSNEPGEAEARENFNSVPLAIISIFRLVTLDGWERPMYEGMVAQNWLLGLAFFIPAYVLFGYMLSSLFTAVILETFEPQNKEELQERELREEENMERHERINERSTDRTEDGGAGGERGENSNTPGGGDDSNAGLGNSSFVHADSASVASHGNEQPTLATSSSSALYTSVTSPQSTFLPQDASRSAYQFKVTRVEKKMKDKSFSLFTLDSKLRQMLMVVVLDKTEMKELKEDRLRSKKKLTAIGGGGEAKEKNNKKKRKTKKKKKKKRKDDKSEVGSGGNDGGENEDGEEDEEDEGVDDDDDDDDDDEANKIPQPKKTYGNFFSAFIMLFVIGSCIQVALEPAAEACSFREARLRTPEWTNTHLAFDIVFFIVFVVEALMKMTVHGVLFPGDDRPYWIGKPYLRDWWNILDFMLLIGMIIAFFYPSVRAVRLFRTLRPLRIIRKVESMRIIVYGIINSLPSIMIVYCFSVYFLFVFGIIGVGLFSGKMNYCDVGVVSGRNVDYSIDCQGLAFNELGVLVHPSWKRHTSHFDHIGAALAFLVEIVSLSEWTGLMEQALDIVGSDRQPHDNHSLQYFVFFGILILTATFFIMNIVVGVLLASLDEQRGVLYLTKLQRDWHTIRKQMQSLKPIPPPVSTLFPRIQQLVTYAWFENAVNVAVFLNILTISSVHYNQNETWTSIQYYSNIVFLVIFFVEMILKLLAFGRHYFSDRWNLIDGAVVVGSTFEFFYQLAFGDRDVTIISIGRTFRILRILRSIKRVQTLRGLFYALLNALPAIASVVFFMLILLFIYAVTAMGIFGSVRFQEHYDRFANFRAMDHAWFALFRMATLDGWNLLMRDLRTFVTPLCNSNVKGVWYQEKGRYYPCGTLNDCSTEVSVFIFFFTFYSIGSYLFLSVVIAIMLDSFNYISTQARTRIRIVRRRRRCCCHWTTRRHTFS